MPVMIREGRRVCNSRCHTAIGAKCRCICGGEFHGPVNYNLRLEENKVIVEELLRVAKENMQREPEGG